MNGDVRMRGFQSRVRVEAAIAWVDAHSAPLPAERVSVTEAAGRVLADDVIARWSVPSFPRAAMDGYALRGAETDGAGTYNPLPFAIVGEAYPGRPYLGPLPKQSCVRIMTGAPLPPGADAVLPAEFAEPRATGIEALTAVPPAKNVGPEGEDVVAGRVVLARGRRLRPQDVALAASVGAAQLAVIGRPRVRLIITGNELVPPGTTPSPWQIVDSNSVLLAALLERDGGTLESIRTAPDDRPSIRAALLDPGADCILVSGGSSVGAEDHAPTLVAELGTLAIHGIAMRPSSPAGMGLIGTTPVFLLPGNPVSCLCAYDFFAGRAIRLRCGRSPDWPYASRVLPVGKKIVSAIGRVDYARVIMVDGQVEPLATSGASILSSTTRAEGFLVVPAEQEGFAPGTLVTVYLYDAPGSTS